jgi:soluble lytic murein transglycosylase-like protein
LTLTRRRKGAAVAILAALTVAVAGTAAADEASPESSWQLRGKVRAGGGSSDARALPGTVDLLHQAACREAQDLLADGEPGRVKVKMAVWRQSGPADATNARVPNVDCDERLERQSAFRTTARVVYPRESGEPARSGSLSLGGAVELAARAANRVAPSVLETGRQASIVVVAAHDEKTVRQMIKSLAVRYRLDPGTAIRIAECESGLNPRAYSPPYAGVFQQNVRLWDGRARRYGHPGASPFDAYANIDVSLQMARASGWGHWGCA